MKVSKGLLTAVTAVVVVLTGTSVALAAPSPEIPAPTQLVGGDPGVRGAAALVAGRPAFLQASADDAFVQGSVITSEGTRYVPYERTYAGLPVIGGDFVIAADAGGKVMANSVAMKRPIGNLSRTPTLAQADAEKVAGKQLKILDKVESTRLVVYALGEEPRLAWESTVAGTGADGANLLTVEVDALTGAVLATQDHVSEGTGDSAFNGPNPIPLNTTRSTSAGACAPVTAPCFALQDPTITGLKCHAYNINDPINSPLIKSTVDRFGNGNSSSVETGCADAMFAAQTQDRMLRQWLGRNSFDGNGGGFRIEVGLTVPNAFHMGGRDPKVQIGRNVNGQLLTSLDIVAHEFGHGIDDKTPGGKSNNNTGEFIADAFAASTEFFANEPAPFDTPDFLFGEVGKFDGYGPDRSMFDPASLGGGINCYSASVPNASTEVHRAAGPGNHWFYLLSQGSTAFPGPASPTCDGSVILNGLGIKDSIRILYNAMLMKTTASSYLRYRVWTLQAAINLFPGNCNPYNAVRNAWNAVSVPQQTDEPTCTGTGAVSDFNGDGKTDFAVFRPTTGQWFIKDIGTTAFGQSGDVPVPGDYNGDGQTDLAVFRPSTGQWFVFGNATVNFGASGDVPVPGDYNGDGKTDLAVFRPSTGQWFVFGNATVNFGASGDVPVPGDYNGDGKTDLAVFRPSTGQWFVFGNATVNFGASGDVPVPGDYNGDGKTDLAVFRPSTGQWFVFGNATVNFGASGDVPVPGDYNGDGKTDLAVFRPSTGQWFIFGGATVGWGARDDIPTNRWPLGVKRAVNDVNGDGRTEFVVYRPSTGQWFVFGGPTVSWGASGDVPVPGDYNGDGQTEYVVFRPSTGQWFFIGGATVSWGVSGDIPVPGDYNGDGKTDVAVFRPSTGQWFVFGGATVSWGVSGDVPVPGDYNGDGQTEYVVFRASTGQWFFFGGATVGWGVSGDVPAPGDYNGDRKTDLTVFRPSTGQWFVLGGATVNLGASGDVPVPGDYNGDGTTEFAVYRSSTGQWFVNGGATVGWGSGNDIPTNRWPLPSQ
ncbi:FG-GAP-like repeat-containing protein [Dactylosporangium sp. NBC_01737]|uniref:FG-GAP-like repeat-containing protein n=1 Tax=Dactylosporangium sp. NBC_01737 TaxID=2975959 RepID=UPI002E106D3A|nr:FG-GAP-like repeat-containing protein [Dactylosporangium sp. NBC_01737]